MPFFFLAMESPGTGALFGGLFLGALFGELFWGESFSL